MTDFDLVIIGILVFVLGTLVGAALILGIWLKAMMRVGSRPSRNPDDGIPMTHKDRILWKGEALRVPTDNEHPTISGYNKNVYWYPEGCKCEDIVMREGWYWFDEVGLLGDHIAYKTEQEAIDKLEYYVREVLG